MQETFSEEFSEWFTGDYCLLLTSIRRCPNIIYNMSKQDYFTRVLLTVFLTSLTACSQNNSRSTDTLNLHQESIVVNGHTLSTDMIR